MEEKNNCKMKHIRKCLYSGEEFIPKRKDQIFKNSKNKSRYHNEKYRKKYFRVIEIDSILKNNYRILEFFYYLLRIRKTTIIELLRLGFNFDIYTSSGSKNFIMVYDFVLTIENNFVFISKN